MEQIVVVGASAAGVAATRTLRRLGFDGRLFLVGEEGPPYRRPPLSKHYLLGASGDGHVGMDIDPDVEVAQLYGTRAIGLDMVERSVRLEGGTTVSFDGLVIATGAQARWFPGSEHLDGVHVLRTLRDAQRIRDRLRESPRVAVIGGGFIGAEVAATARTLGLEVHLVEAAPFPFARPLGEEIGRVLAEVHADHGTHVHLGVPVKRLIGSGHVAGVELGDGTRISADLVVAGLGVRPATQWLADSGLMLDDGVVCDTTCAVGGAENVVAAGDVARWRHALFDTVLRVEHWDNALLQGGAAARRLLGGDSYVKPFIPIPYFWSDQYDTKIQFVGIRHPGDIMTFAEGGPAARSFVAVYMRENRVVGAVAMNAAHRVATYRKLIAGQASADEVKLAAVA